MICSTCGCEISAGERVDSVGDHMNLLRCIDVLRAKVEALAEAKEIAVAGRERMEEGE